MRNIILHFGNLSPTTFVRDQNTNLLLLIKVASVLPHWCKKKNIESIRA
jgi:hypothetical protein